MKSFQKCVETLVYSVFSFQKYAQTVVYSMFCFQKYEETAVYSIFSFQKYVETVVYSVFSKLLGLETVVSSYFSKPLAVETDSAISLAEGASLYGSTFVSYYLFALSDSLFAITNAKLAKIPQTRVTFTQNNTFFRRFLRFLSFRASISDYFS